MKLHDYLKLPRTFERGTCDCVRFVADWAAIACGQPVAEEYRKPMTREEAEEVLEAYDGMEGAVAYFLTMASDRWQEVMFDETEDPSPELGDIAVCLIYGYGNGGHIETTTVGIVDQRGRVVVFAEDSTLARLPGKSILAVWRCV